MEEIFISNVLRRSFSTLACIKIQGLKLPQLLSQFLYQTRKLDLPGIGSFTLDAGAVIPQESDRMGQVPASGITFKNANIPTADEALILFIKEHTGKMKSLASADLDFYLTTGRQLLNIGKPFYLEGIGTLIKNKEGRLDFTPGEYMVARLEDPHAERKATTFDEAPRHQDTGGSNSRQMLLLIGLIGGLIVIGWGGYYLYKRNNFVEPTSENRATVIPDTTPSRTGNPATTGDNTRPAETAGKTDTLTKSTTPAGTAGNPPAPKGTQPATTPASGAQPNTTPPVTQPTTFTPVPTAGQSLFHFVILQTANKNRALRRYNQLLGYQLNIKMDQKDSSYFKLYFPIAATIRDTTHIKDSLEDVYAAHVTIEK